MRTIPLGRRPPDFRPARIATANMLSDSGARESPASIGGAMIALPIYLQMVLEYNASAIC
jgi:hypothetical protein